MRTNVENEMTKDKNIIIISFLKKCIEHINLKHEVNMCLFQPGLEPLSLIGKTEQEILTELHNNIIIMLTEFNSSGNISLSSEAFKPFFGIDMNSLKKIATKLIGLLPFAQLMDEELEEQFIIIDAYNNVNNILNGISYNMLTNYLKEFLVLLQDFQDFSITSKQISETSFLNITSSQSASNYFRIMCKDAFYCTIADAVIANNINENIR